VHNPVQVAKVQTWVRGAVPSCSWLSLESSHAPNVFCGWIKDSFPCIEFYWQRGFQLFGNRWISTVSGWNEINCWFSSSKNRIEIICLVSLAVSKFQTFCKGLSSWSLSNAEVWGEWWLYMHSAIHIWSHSISDVFLTEHC